MKLLVSIALFGAMSCAMPLASAQDITDGTILALDRKAKRMVLTDRTVWPLESLKSSLPANLKAGDRVRISYESDEEGISAINEIDLVPADAPRSSAGDVSEGTVLVYDRKARVLVLTDRSVWSLEALKAQAPAGLKAGDRVQIQYESDEEGVSAINSIEVLAN